MAWTTPTSVNPGDAILASLWNTQVKGNMDELAPFSIAWTTFTPTFTNLTVGNAAVSAKYLQVGKVVVYRGRLVWGSTTTASGVTKVSLPASRNGSPITNGSGFIYDSSPGRFYLIVCNAVDASAAEFYHTEAGGGGIMTGLDPFTWASGDVLQWTITYEAA